MKYLDKKFSVGSPGTAEYATNWEHTFGGSQAVTPAYEGESAFAPTSTPVGECVHLHPGVGGGRVWGGVASTYPEGGGGYPEPLQASPETTPRQFKHDRGLAGSLGNAKEATQKPHPEAMAAGVVGDQP
jgi:hypothetical protein